MKPFMYSAAVAVLLVQGAQASSIAIIDSGVDYQHPFLVMNYLKNDAEKADNKVDDDKNGYVDDVYGWNFAESNNQVIDYSYLPRFNADHRRFFEIQNRSLRGTATQEDKDWMKAKRADEAFIKELGVFGNFTHGSHVAGISVRDHLQSQVFAIKLIPTEIKLPFRTMVEKTPLFQSSIAATSGLKDMLFEFGLQMLAKQQAKIFKQIGEYVAVRKADVANGSFGTSTMAALNIIKPIYELAYKEEERSEAQMIGFAKFFVSRIVTESQVLVSSSPKTLFVFAAGNDGTDNDELPTSPANIRADNVISVAATLDHGSLAVFSNYGRQLVDVAAPGVGIESSIPGNHMMVMSGTSQAAPYVANVAGEIKNLNPNLTPAEVKRLIVGTVDSKAWLKSKVKSEGVVNAERAYFAAKLSVKESIQASIEQSRSQVADVAVEPAPAPVPGIGGPSVLSRKAAAEEAGVLPLPNPIR